MGEKTLKPLKTKIRIKTNKKPRSNINIQTKHNNKSQTKKIRRYTLWEWIQIDNKKARKQDSKKARKKKARHYLPIEYKNEQGK